MAGPSAQVAVHASVHEGSQAPIQAIGPPVEWGMLRRGVPLRALGHAQARHAEYASYHAVHAMLQSALHRVEWIHWHDRLLMFYCAGAQECGSGVAFARWHPHAVAPCKSSALGPPWRNHTGWFAVHPTS
eukprot:CAMPEP_0198133626 /NCGR_PEP_ID=MMETSP1442-20131203/59663_1 /TAXON_ID= /ORGANISM="Craspedostauros australis, Strain CCMP3328" /LENGTH=129 /DNA_ID=CAMNT_0043794755 /DNA_START=847 /DNA_END=1236 /DNA_ORIENTATION=-